MQSVLILGAILIAFTAIGDAVSLRLRMPQSILLVMLGAGLSLTPVAPRVVIDSQLMLLLFLPPLIYSSGVGMGIVKPIAPVGNAVEVERSNGPRVQTEDPVLSLQLLP